MITATKVAKQISAQAEHYRKHQRWEEHDAVQDVARGLALEIKDYAQAVRFLKRCGVEPVGELAQPGS